MAEHEEHGSGCGRQHGTITVADDSVGRSLRLAMRLNLFIPLCQFVGGGMAQSMAVISVAVHNLGGSTSLLVANVAHRIGKKAPSGDDTFGFRKVEVQATLLNVAPLCGVCLSILFETAAGSRFRPSTSPAGLWPPLPPSASWATGSPSSFCAGRRSTT